MNVPFRLYLHGTADEHSTQLLMRILDAHIRNSVLDDLLDIIDTANEIVLWQLARQLHEKYFNMGVFPRDESDWNKLVVRFLSRALRDADSEGVVWTPLLDAIADSDAWERIVTIRDSIRVSIPSALERAERLVPWISSTRDPELLRGLLRYRSRVIHMVLARHVCVQDLDLLLSIPLTPGVCEQFAQNPALDAGSREALIAHAYDAWRKVVDPGFRLGSNVTLDRLGEPQAGIVRAFLCNGFSLPSAARKHAFDIIVNKKVLSKPEHALEFLLLDKTTPVEYLEQLPPEMANRYADQILLHPNCSDGLWQRMAAKNQIALESVLLKQQFSADRVAFAYKLALDSKNVPNQNLLYAVLRQHAGTSEMWLESLGLASTTDSRALRSHILTALAENQRARQHPEVRKALLEHGTPAILRLLLEDGRPEEFEDLLVRLYRAISGPAVAISFLREHKVPPGTPFPMKLMKLLLNSQDSDHRLLAITLIDEFKAAPEAVQALDNVISSGTKRPSKRARKP